MRVASTVIAIGSMLWLAATSAHALGFGRIINATQLGQPLNFAAVVREDAADPVPRECVSAEVFAGDIKLQAGVVRVTLEDTAVPHDRSVRVTTTVPIDEPVVTVSVGVGCPTKMNRRFVVFVDPPGANLPRGSAQAMPSLPPQRLDTQVAPLLDIVQGAARADRQAAQSNRKEPERRMASLRTRSRPTSVASSRELAEPAPASTGARKTAEDRRAPAVAQPTGGSGRPRLELEPAPRVEAKSPSLSASSGVTPPSAITSANLMPAAQTASGVQQQQDEQSQLLAMERQRIALLEEGLATLRKDSAATQQSLALLQARLRQAESERYANPLVYGLGLLSGLLTLAVAGLWWRHGQAARQAEWWKAQTMFGDASVHGAMTRSPGQSTLGPLDSRHTMAGALEQPSRSGEESASVPLAAPTPTPAPAPAPVVSTAPIEVQAVQPVQPVAEAARELSVEELIDLEQQAEFFIVLGQDEEAIELLMSHVRSDGGISPLPYLKLLEIFRRRGETEAYERIRERFNRRFNAYAPDWESDLQQGRSLLDYPDTVAQLEAMWVTPSRAMETLDASLFRRNSSDETFELPAYREILLLYSIARDLAERGAGDPHAEVDLLLPLSEEGEEPISRLVATTGAGEFHSSELMTLALDLDVSSEPAPVEFPYGDDSETAPSALRRSSGQDIALDSGFLDVDLSRVGKPDSNPRG